jgi:hypothetical protein
MASFRGQGSEKGHAKKERRHIPHRKRRAGLLPVWLSGFSFDTARENTGTWTKYSSWRNLARAHCRVFSRTSSMHGVVLQESNCLRSVLNDSDLASTNFGPHIFNQQRWSLKSYRTAGSGLQRLQRVHRVFANQIRGLQCHGAKEIGK